jgi:UDP-2,3-diacylglucosamine pyrophosphatase LpxH
VASLNTITWGQGNKSTVLSEDRPTKNHVFTLANLEPGSTYWYRLNNEVDISFTTPPLEDSLQFAVASDVHFGAGDSRNDLTAKMLNEIGDPINAFDMFFILGDLVEYGLRNNQWHEAFNTLSPTTSVIPTKFAVGNHDTLFSGFDKYQSYCYPQEMELQTGSRLWYRVDVGKLHFLILDLEWNVESFTSKQARWLETQLRDIPIEDWKIVMSHGFYYSSGSVDDGWKWYDNHETITRLTPIFEKYRVQVVFSGHNHHLELLQNSGITYVICGSFGGTPDIERSYTSPSSLWYMSGQYGFVDVTINGNQCSLDFRDSDFNVLKTLTLVKNH